MEVLIRPNQKKKNPPQMGKRRSRNVGMIWKTPESWPDCDRINLGDKRVHAKYIRQPAPSAVPGAGFPS
ncbi:MAG: hypothetical protein DCC59_11375 [Chloroflexi bacterium]|nr:MAG: hypothetical protein DCC59_11375 [Chloroflexota bacterium]